MDILARDDTAAVADIMGRGWNAEARVMSVGRPKVLAPGVKYLLKPEGAAGALDEEAMAAYAAKPLGASAEFDVLRKENEVSCADSWILGGEKEVGAVRV